MNTDAGIRGTDGGIPTDQQRGTGLGVIDSQKVPAMFALRDPFAELGQIGNRQIQYGSDGKIPAKYQSKVEEAIILVYKLALNEKFINVFRTTVSKLIGKELTKDAYLDALDKMVINLADTSANPKVRKFLIDEAEAIKKDRTYQLIPAITVPVGGRNVYFREFQLKKAPIVIAGSLMHEATHVAGAPANDLAEIALEAIHNIGYPRK